MRPTMTPSPRPIAFRRSPFARRGPIAALAVLAALAAGCAGPEPPQWVSGSPDGYPRDRYVVGVGSGPDAEQAAARARDEVARQTNGELEGVRVAETWVDEDEGEHFALAVLDRAALLDAIADELLAVEREMTAKLAEADAAPPAGALRAVLDAMALAPRRAALIARIANLGAPAPPADPALSRSGLETRLAAVKRELPIEIEAYEMDSKTGAIGEPLDEVRRALAQKVLALGFPLSDRSEWGASESAWLSARARVAFERLQLHPRDRLVAVHWEAALEITDLGDDARVVAILTEEARATHLNEREARRQAQEDAEAFLAAALADWLVGRSTPHG